MSKFRLYKVFSVLAAVPLLASGQAGAAVILSQGANGTVGLAGVIAGTSLSATAGYLVNTYNATQLVITWTLTNTTPAVTAGQNRAVSFGFDLVPPANRTLTTATSTNGWGVSVNNVNITNGTRVDVCAWDGNNCTGGSNQGVGEGLVETFTLTLNGSFTNPLSMDNFYARYQSIGSSGASGIIGERGNPPEVDIPEPATLALLGLGLLSAGFATRRRAA